MMPRIVTQKPVLQVLRIQVYKVAAQNMDAERRPRSTQTLRRSKEEESRGSTKGGDFQRMRKAIATGRAQDCFEEADTNTIESPLPPQTIISLSYQLARAKKIPENEGRGVEYKKDEEVLGFQGTARTRRGGEEAKTRSDKGREAGARLRECEAVIEMVKTQAREQEERRNRERREQEEELKRERSQRQEQEQLVHSLRQQLEEEKRRRDEALRSSSCENEMMGAEKKRLLEQIDVLKASVKSLKEKLSAQQLEAQSSQRKLMEQRSEAEHKMKLEHQDHLSHKESELIDMSAAHARQLKMLQDQLDKTNSEKVKLEIDMRKIKSELQDVLIRHEEEISQIKESCRREEDGRIAYLDEKISSIQQARELQQQRSDQLALELAELRKLENYRLKEHDNLLKQEVEHRLEVEKVAEARQTELEGLRIENMRLKHKLMAAEEGMQRSEEELRANTQQQERTIKELLETDGMRSRQLEEEIRSARNRISSLETELRKKEIDQSRAREEEVVRMSRLQERILEKVREELMNLS
mmetsp:Transcript_24328/g.79424  ORF Transcript_24328/g.79424 Transcript_24328/m.79424 type:complete len:528 (-) Transcript_24328:1282-2865(-)